MIIGITYCANAQMVAPKQDAQIQSLIETLTRNWKLTLRIVDEGGQPVMGAKAGVGNNIAKLHISGLTDTNGIFVASHRDAIEEVGIYAKKNGYYSFHESHLLGREHEFLNSTIKIILREIGKPIPMYAKQAHMIFQQVGTPMGFDLGAGDWVTPYGKGFHTDIIFTLLHRQIINQREYDCELKLTFPNHGDGIAVAPAIPVAGSEFKTSRTASETGYEPELDLHYSNTNHPPSVFGYFIRVRTELNPDGSIKSALYGKIAGNFRFYAGTIAPTSGMGFTYYLNPTPNDRNVEFNPKKNLIKDLKFDEEVKEP